MSIFSVVNDILAAGVGSSDGISGIFKAEASNIAASIAKQSALKNFKYAGFKATADISNVALKNASGKTFHKTFKAGSIVTADSYENMEAILKAANADGVAWNKGAAGSLVSSKYISDSDINKLSKDAQNVAIDKNKTLNDMLNNFNAVRKDIVTGYNGIDFSDLGASGTGIGDEISHLRTSLGRTDKQKGIGFDNLAKGYFDDTPQGTMRMKGVGGTAFGGAVAMRFLQGGDFTHNARGENDIAGIPFY